MKRVIMLIPVWQRYEITEFCYLLLQQSIGQAAGHGIELVPYIIASDFDHQELAERYGFNWVYSPNDYVSDKLNRGLAAVLPLKSDYITVIGSDNKLVPGIWEHIAKEIDNDTPFFGWSEVRFINTVTNDVINAQYPCTTGVARFHRTDLLRKIARRYKVHILESHIDGDKSYNRDDIVIVSRVSGLMHKLEEYIGIWTPGMMTGMDMDSEKLIRAHGYDIKHMRGQFIYDFKSDENLTTWDEIANNLTVVDYATDHAQ